MQEVEIKTKSGMAATTWLKFTGSWSSSYAGFMTSAVPIRYSCATKRLQINGPQRHLLINVF